MLRRKERGCGSCIVAPESTLSSGGSSMGMCVGCSSMVVGGRGEMLRVQSSQGAGAAFTGCWCCLHRVLVLPSQGAGAAWLIPGPSAL